MLLLPGIFEFLGLGNTISGNLGQFNLSSPRQAKTVPFVILLCLMRDDFTHQWRAFGEGKG